MKYVYILKKKGVIQKYSFDELGWSNDMAPGMILGAVSDTAPLGCRRYSIPWYIDTFWKSDPKSESTHFILQHQNMLAGYTEDIKRGISPYSASINKCLSHYPYPSELTLSDNFRYVGNILAFRVTGACDGKSGLRDAVFVDGDWKLELPTEQEWLEHLRVRLSKAICQKCGDLRATAEHDRNRCIFKHSQKILDTFEDMQKDQTDFYTTILRNFDKSILRFDHLRSRGLDEISNLACQIILDSCTSDKNSEQITTLFAMLQELLVVNERMSTHYDNSTDRILEYTKNIKQTLVSEYNQSSDKQKDEILNHRILISHQMYETFLRWLVVVHHMECQIATDVLFRVYWSLGINKDLYDILVNQPKV